MNLFKRSKITVTLRDAEEHFIKGMKGEKVMKKRSILALALSLILVVAMLAACGGGGGGGETPAGSGGSTPAGSGAAAPGA